MEKYTAIRISDGTYQISAAGSVVGFVDVWVENNGQKRFRAVERKNFLIGLDFDSLSDAAESLL